jgi:acetyl esterase/lipase
MLPWVLAVAAVLAAIPVAVVAWCIVRPVRFGGMIRVGAAALTFPLHLLVPAAGLAGVAIVAAILGAGWAAAAFAGLTVVVVALALGPTVAVARRAGALEVPLSLREYVARARRPNFGGAGQGPAHVFATVDGVELVLDWWPAAAGPGPRADGVTAPAVVKVHGGGWTGGGRNEAIQWNRWLNELGYHVFDVDYRLAPPPRWEDAAADVQQAVAWVAEQGGAVGVDPTRISLMGHSAGGHLALLAGYRSAASGGGSPSVRCIVNIYGPCDLGRLYGTGASHVYLDQCLRSFTGGPPAELPDRYRAVSALDGAGPAAPPTLTLHGRRDRVIPVEQAALLDDALTAAGVTHETCLLPATDHGFDINWGGFATQIARARVERFLRQHG